MNIRRDEPSGLGDPRPDPLVGEWLAELDPGRDDPGYWTRFHIRAMARGRGELARRRAAGEVTVYDLVASWSRAVVPVTLAAAAVAAFLLLRPLAPVNDVPRHIGIEELLAEGLQGEAVPARPFDAGGTEAIAVFAAEVF